ncbi:hypothetical protein E4U13_007461 [Claviceps humidiphila]|uniref:Uncharacterized protein n=1 Tax=Claviceps humidiphila TaxID=1294629 RepID=A0A9P7PT96_9HYPO|nr:hypothetical protein E4U13_007461 [Claviceps humidiphila]
MTVGYGDLSRLPRRTEPWMAIKNHDFISKIDLVMPLDKFLTMPSEIILDRPRPVYYRLAESSLEQLLNKESLFNFLQKGEATLFSQRHVSATHIQFNVNKGILTMHMDESTFERSGLSDSIGLVKGQRMRIVTLDLNSARRYCNGETHKHLEQYTCACKSITKKQLSWLLCDETGSTNLALDLGNDVNVLECTAELKMHQGTTCNPPMLDIGRLSFMDTGRLDMQEIGLCVYEWLSLLKLDSPRVQYGDDVDTFLSRYRVASRDREQVRICRISWVGLIGTSWFQNLVRDVMTVNATEGWLSFSSNSFYDASLSGIGSELVMLRPSTKEDQYLMWRLQGFV